MIVIHFFTICLHGTYRRNREKLDFYPHPLVECLLDMVKISGVTFVKDAISLGYPFVESIKSIALLCDEVVINVGFGDPDLEHDDGTWEVLRGEFSQHARYILMKSFWNPDAVTDGLILSQQMNIALRHCRGKYCQYIQADEAVHEEDFPAIEEGIRQMEENPAIDGLVYNFLHFYADPYIRKHTRNTYRKEVRLIRNRPNIVSWKDAQGFRFDDSRKIHAVENPARIFHYGWSRREDIMDKKNKAFAQLYHGREHQEQDFTYQHIWGLSPFKGSHPSCMKEWIEHNRNPRDILSLPRNFEWKNITLAISDFIEKYSGYRIGEYKNYKLLPKGNL